MKKKTAASKDGFLTAQADASAIAGTYTITVEKVAQRHQITTAPANSTNTTGTIQLDDKIGKDDTFKIGSKDVTVTKDMTYKDVVNKINNGNYGVSVYSLGGTFIFLHQLQRVKMAK